MWKAMAKNVVKMPYLKRWGLRFLDNVTHTFVVTFSRLPRHHKNRFCTVFNTPACAQLKNDKMCILGLKWANALKKKNFLIWGVKNCTKLFFKVSWKPRNLRNKTVHQIYWNLIIPPFELNLNWDWYAHAMYRSIFQWYQGAEKQILKISNSTSTTGKLPVVFHHTNSMQAHKCIVNDRTHVVWINWWKLNLWSYKS